MAQPDRSAPGTVAPLRIVVAHGQAIVREGTRRILEAHPGFDVVAETVSLADAVPLVEVLKPDVLVLGLERAEIGKRAQVQQLRGVLLITRVLVLEDGVPPRQLARSGVTGWVSNMASPPELVAGIRAAAAGRQPSTSPSDLGATDGHMRRPTPRELEVLTLIERGLPTRSIALQLQTTPRTIHFHVGNLFVKLGARSRIEMLHLARLRGWIE